MNGTVSRSMPRVIAVGGSLVLLLALGVGAARAYLTPPVLTMPLSIMIEAGDGGVAVPIDIDGLSPGVSDERVFRVSTGSTSISADPTVLIDGLVDWEDGCVHPEVAEGDDCGDREGELSQDLLVTLSTVAVPLVADCAGATYTEVQPATRLAELADGTNDLIALLDRALTRTEALCVRFGFELPWESGNETQTDRSTFDLTFTVEQDTTPSREVKDIAIEQLRIFADAPANAKERDQILKAIEHIEKSLLPEYWIDDDRLSEKGKKVFYEERKAAYDLLKKYVGNQDARDVALWLAAVDEHLALAAQQTADDYRAETLALINATSGIAAGDRQEALKKLTEAADKLAKGQEKLDEATAELADGDIVDAIDRHKKAWEEFQEAEKKVDEALSKAKLHRTLADRRLTDATARLADARSLAAGWTGDAGHLAKAGHELDEAQSKLAEAQARFDAGDATTGSTADDHYKHARKAAEDAIKKILKGLKELGKA